MFTNLTDCYFLKLRIAVARRHQALPRSPNLAPQTTHSAYAERRFLNPRGINMLEHFDNPVMFTYLLKPHIFSSRNLSNWGALCCCDLGPESPPPSTPRAKDERAAPQRGPEPGTPNYNIYGCSQVHFIDILHSTYHLFRCSYRF